MQIKARELTNADVDLVSMVKRGANRTPFRITKGDNEMLDLHKIGRMLVAKGDETPIIVGVVVPSGLDVSKIMKDAGIDLDGLQKSEKDGVVVITKGDSVPDDSVVVKSAGGVGLVCTGIKKAFTSYDFESTMFSDVMSQGAFFPSVCTASDMLRYTIGNIMEKSESPKDAATMIQKAANEFGQYITALAKTLPERAFKADVALAKAAKKTKPMADQDADDAKAIGAKKQEEISESPAVDKSTGRPSGVSGGKQANPAGAADNDIEDSPVAGNEKGVTGVPVTGSGDVTTDQSQERGRSSTDMAGLNVKKNEGDADILNDPKRRLTDDKSGAGAQQGDARLEEVVKNSVKETVTGALSSAMDPLKKLINDTFASLDGEMKALKADISGIKEKVKKTDEVVHGTVIGDAVDDRTGRRAMKGDDEDSGDNIPLLDTAFMKIDDEDKRPRVQ